MDKREKVILILRTVNVTTARLLKRLRLKTPLTLLLGCLLTAVGILFLKQAQAVTGGTAGLSLGLSYLWGLPFGVLFVGVNAPFFVFSWVRMGARFTLLSIAASVILSGLASLGSLLPDWHLPMLVGEVIGGVFIGLGVSVLFMGGASFGGANILSLYLHQKYKWNPGIVNFVFDFIVLLISFSMIGIMKAACSALSIVVTSWMISRFKGRYRSVNRAELRTVRKKLEDVQSAGSAVENRPA
ncbi:YitT family protein [Paenibacillus turpanensis]|uniref:YitT family protein n=1 Tax=Paenibacillus turpanensis TaxID=2689078 RepID=UPI00140B4CA1|nr:YitT family protein [Paenibacillus turpanensis]